MCFSTEEYSSQDRFRALLNISEPRDFVSIFGVEHTRGTMELNPCLSEPCIISLRSPRALILTRIPSTPIDSLGATECALDPSTKELLSSFPTHPRFSVQESYTVANAYEIRHTATKSLGMFALRDLNVGDLIIVERPLMVLPYMYHNEDPAMTPEQLSSYLHSLMVNNRPGLFTYAIPRVQAVLLKALFARMTQYNQEVYRGLPKNDEHYPLLGRYRKNSISIGDMGLGDGRRYDAVCRDASWINRSGHSNCFLRFDISTFSVQVRATKAITEDEEILLHSV